MSILKRIVTRIAHTQAAYVLQAAAVVAVEKRNRARIVEALNGMTKRYNALEDLVTRQNASLEDLASRLRTARCEADQARTEHAEYVSASSAAYAKSFGELAAAHAKVADIVCDVVSILEIPATSTPEAIRDVLTDLVDSKRKEGMRASTRMALDTQIRDLIDVRRENNRLDLLSLVKLHVEQARAFRDESVRLRDRPAVT